MRLHSLCILQGGGAEDFEGGSRNLGTGKGGMSSFFHNMKGDANIFVQVSYICKKVLIV